MVQKQNRKGWNYLREERRYDIQVVHDGLSINLIYLSHYDFSTSYQVGKEKYKELTVDRSYLFVIVSYHSSDCLVQF